MRALSSGKLEIRPFRNADGPRVRELVIAVNRLLSPSDLRDAFEAYIERTLADEIDRIEDYYSEHGGGRSTDGTTVDGSKAKRRGQRQKTSLKQFSL